MGVFESSRTIETTVENLAPVAEALMAHFREQGYEAEGIPTALQGWHISLHKGGAFQAIVGTKTALNIEIEPADNATKCKAGVGIFGTQAIPTTISMLVLWPVLVTQIWGLVKQSKLDDEALDVLETLLCEHAANAATGCFCTQCGTRLPPQAKFCAECSVKTCA